MLENLEASNVSPLKLPPTLSLINANVFLSFPLVTKPAITVPLPTIAVFLAAVTSL